MIPLPIAPLQGVAVLVTRPAVQSEKLCQRIGQLGGVAIVFPVVAIEPLVPAATTMEYDWFIFVSANAVHHGIAHLRRTDRTRIAAIGAATAAALEAHSLHVDARPERGSTSEELLAHPAFSAISGLKILIVKGVGGRELLHDVLIQRGASVSTLDVYRRTLPSLSANSVQLLEQRWQEEGIDIVTLTSVESLENLLALLTGAGRTLLTSTPFVTVSERIATAARNHGLAGTGVMSRGADDDSIIGAIAAWHARAR